MITGADVVLRFLVKFLLLTIILAAAVILTAQWKLKKDLDEFSLLVSPVADFSYESAKIGLTGEVRVTAISTYIEAINTRIEIGEVTLSVGNLLDLALFKSNLNNKQIPDRGYITLTDVLIPFTPQLIDAAADDTPPTSMDLIQSAYCGDKDKIGLREIEAMGYDYLSFSGRDFFMLDRYSGSMVINGNFNIEEMFDVAYQVNIGGMMKWLEAIQQQRAIGQFQEEIIEPDLELFELRVKDKGFNLKRAMYCSLRESTDTENYYTQHVSEAEKLLNSVNIQFTESAKTAYAESIKPNSDIFFFLKPKANFDFDGFSYYSAQELLDMSGLRVMVNDTAVTEFLSGWSGENFAKISQNVIQERAKDDPSQPLYRQVVVTKEYHDLPVSTARQYIGFQVRVRRDDGKLFDGKLSRAEDSSIWITQRSASGEITIPVALTRVSQFQVYK